jgi:hypothetical protein
VNEFAALGEQLEEILRRFRRVRGVMLDYLSSSSTVPYVSGWAHRKPFGDLREVVGDASSHT